MICQLRGSRYLIAVGLCMISFHAKAQIPTIQDCLGAIPVCEQIYREQQVLPGSGNYANELDENISCLVEDVSGIWYTFTVNSSGDFGFLLSPIDPDDDYDWALFNITNARCEDIRRDASLLVSCNAAGSLIGTSPNCNGATGATGQSNFAIQGGGCNSNIVDNFSARTQLNDLIPVVQGNTYALFVSNWTGSTNGYEIDFGFSEDIGILDETPPEVRTVMTEEAEGCSPSFLDLTFTELIKCNSIDLENFSLTDDSGNLYDIAVSSLDCDLGAALSREFRIDIMDVLPIGTYNLQVEGSATFLIVDPCDNELATYNYTLEIDKDALSEIALPTDTTACDVASITLDVSDDQASAYLWQDGSTSSSLTITQSGTYSVEVSNQCDIKTSEIDVLILNDRAVVVDLGQDTSICIGMSYIIDPQLSGDLTYTWSDGSNNPTTSVNTSDTYELVVSDACGELGTDEVMIEVKDLPIDIDLGGRTIFCTGDVVNLDATNINATEYLWSDGSTEATLTVSMTGDYSVVVTNECESTTDEIVVNESACVECNVYYPNIISLSSQIGNSNFKVESNCPFITYEIKVYDRWGGLMHTATDQGAMWDGITNGKPVLNGTYTYNAQISYIEFDETIEENLTGTITVIQ